MAKRQKLDPARTRPLTLEFLRELGALKDFSAPAGDFDPNGKWTQAYRLWLVQRFLGGGSVRLRRRRAGDKGAVRLDVDLAVAEHTGYLRRTRAVLDCAADKLCTPTAWTLESRSIGVDGRPVPATTVSERGTIGAGRMKTRFGGHRRTRAVPAPVTSNWSLFDAVQRLAPAKIQPIRFAVLEEMDLLKTSQRLAFREAKRIELGGRTLRLHGYERIGRGVLPWQYWVDASGRLLFAFSGLRAWIYDPKAEQWMQGKLDKARDRIKRRRKARRAPAAGPAAGPGRKGGGR